MICHNAGPGSRSDARAPRAAHPARATAGRRGDARRYCARPCSAGGSPGRPPRTPAPARRATSRRPAAGAARHGTRGRQTTTTTYDLLPRPSLLPHVGLSLGCQGHHGTCGRAGNPGAVQGAEEARRRSVLRAPHRASGPVRVARPFSAGPLPARVPFYPSGQPNRSSRTQARARPGCSGSARQRLAARGLSGPGALTNHPARIGPTTAVCSRDGRTIRWSAAGRRFTFAATT